MAEIALRAYVKEIDDLVEREQLDEAIAHSRHVLETYPKHLDTYRLLGKAYLEAKRYGDAADLFQRVLSAIPDDFVAHIGMSIVREDEGNLDASIWHMERAFETNPANPAIQQELRRLIGKRDGLEPHKVRLTRGALARMYAHGELYPQAIAELRSALQEDPDRPDLQVLLANLYWRTDQKEQAAEVGQQILEKLPYCRDANRIAAGFLQGIGRTDEATSSHRRLAALDPYAAFVETAMVEPATVDPGSVHLLKLEWRPGHPVVTPNLPRASWSDSLGAGLRAEQRPTAAPEGPLPTWLAPNAPPPSPESLPPAPPSTDESSAGIHPFAGAKEPPADIPSWMREAGWSESSGEAVEGPVSFTDAELAGASPASGEGALAPADIPDWLRDIAPQQMPDEEAGLTPSNWLGEGAEQPSEAAPPAAPVAPPVSAPRDGAERSEVPTWLEEPSPGATETIVTWLGDRSARAAAMQPAPAPPPEPEPEPEPAAAEQPDWLAQGDPFGEEEAAEAPPPAQDAPPAWLTGVAEAAASEEQITAEAPSWVTQPPPEPEPEDVVPEVPSTTEAPDWLRAIADPEATPAPSAQAEADWLAGLSSAAASKPKAADSSGPEWLRGIGEPDDEVAAEPATGSAPDWLRGLGGTTPPTPPAEPTPTTPDWLSDTPAPESAGTSGAAVGAAGTGFDWLRGIGEPEPTDESPESPLPSAQATEEGDDWLRGLVGRGAEAAEEMPSERATDGWSEEDAGEAEPATSEPPDWLGRLAAAAPPPETAGTAPPPSWLEEMAAGGEPEAEPEPDWVQRMPGIVRPPEPREPEPATDDWLKGLLDESPVPDESIVPEESGEPDWFAPQPVADQPTTDFGAEIRVATTGWLREVGEEAIPPDSLEPAATPDWLKEFEAAGPPTIPPTDRTVVAGRSAEWGQRAGDAQPPVGNMDASTAGELGEDDVQKWLEALASRQEAGSGAGIEEAPPAEASSFFPPEMLPEPATPPEDAEDGMEWLDQLSGQPKPEPAAPSWQPVDQEPEPPRAEVASSADAEDEEVPDWLRSLAAEGEVVEPAEAEVAAEDQAPDWLLTTASSTVVRRASVEIPAPPVPPEPPEAPEALEDDEAPDWLRASPVEPPLPKVLEPASEEIEETPAWLLSAAEEAEPAEPPRAYEEEETGGMPDWLIKAAEPEETARSIVPAEPEEVLGELPTPLEPPEVSPPVVAPEPTWMRPSEPAVDHPVSPEAEIIVPEWLRAPVEAPKATEREPRIAPQAPEPVLAAEALPAETPTPVIPEPIVVVPPPPQPIAAPALHVEAPVPAPVAAPPPQPIAAPALPVEAPAPAPVAAPPPQPIAAPALPVEAPAPAPVAAPPPEPIATPALHVEAPVSAPVAAPPPPPEPAVEEQAPAPARPAKARTTARSAQETLAAARQSMASNDLQGAAKHYGALTRRRTLLPDVLADLKVAVSRLPDSPELWQALGDAYMKADQAAEAVEAYRHGLANL